MYTDINFKSKKALKEAVEKWVQYQAQAADVKPMTVGAMLLARTPRPRPVRVYQPNDMVGNPKAAHDYTGSAVVEGPHYPEPHRWGAQVQLKDGIVVKVK